MVSFLFQFCPLFWDSCLSAAGGALAASTAFGLSLFIALFQMISSLFSQNFQLLHKFHRNNPDVCDFDPVARFDSFVLRWFQPRQFVMLARLSLALPTKQNSTSVVANVDAPRAAGHISRLWASCHKLGQLLSEHPHSRQCTLTFALCILIDRFPVRFWIKRIFDVGICPFRSFSNSRNSSVLDSKITPLPHPGQPRAVHSAPVRAGFAQLWPGARRLWDVRRRGGWHFPHLICCVQPHVSESSFAPPFKRTITIIDAEFEL